MKKLIQIFLAYIHLNQLSGQEDEGQQQFSYLTHSEIYQKFTKYSRQYPEFLKYKDIYDEFPYQNLQKTSCGNYPCKLFYAELSDFSNPKYKENPQIFLVGGFHGDEQIGPNVITYLMQYIIDNKDTQEFRELLRNRMLVLMPMANPSGYNANVRTEYNAQLNQYIDMNRDFPYDNDASGCFKTTGARAVNHIMQTHLIVGGITFHGGMYALSYAWGSPNHMNKNHRGELSPDNHVFQQIGEYMAYKSPGNIELALPDYPVGTLTNVIYEVAGSFEDWAYSASWEQGQGETGESIFPKCEGISNQELEVKKEQNKALIYLIEASDPKKPDISKLGTYNSIGKINDKGYGLIPRNIDASLALIKSVSPYIILRVLNLGNYTLRVEWTANGCFTVDSTQLFYRIYDPQQSDDLTGYSLRPPYINISDNMKNQTTFTEIFKSGEQQKLEFIIFLSCDSSWRTQDSGEQPNVRPQSHVVRSRLEQNYFAQNQGYMFKSTKTIRVEEGPFLSTSEASAEFLKSEEKLEDFSLYYYLLIIPLIGSLVTIATIIGIRKQNSKYSNSHNIIQEIQFLDRQKQIEHHEDIHEDIHDDI